jgi:hypothetical protein
MKIFIALLLALAASGAAASDSFSAAAQASAPTHPALYSFADVYWLTVSGAPASAALLPGSDLAIRVAVSQPAGVPETHFTVVSMAQPGRWLLLLAGLAAALWVARRRLGYYF